MPDFEIHGECDDRFQTVRETFVRHFAEGLELGSSFALIVDEELVVDLWGGFADADRARPWEKDTIVSVASSSKIPVSLCGLMLIDRGLIQPDEPIATYWPEFAANGKEGVLVRHAFSHSAGLPGLDGLPGWDILADYEEITRRLAGQKPWWTPGEKCGYHGFTFGHLLGELVRRTSGKTISDFFRSEVAEKAGIDFSFGLQTSDARRLAEIEHADEGPPEPVPEHSYYYRALGYIITQVDMEGIPVWEANVPAINGVTNARALASIGSILAGGGTAFGENFLSAQTVSLAWQEQIYKRDLIFGTPVRYGLGFGLASNEFPLPWPHSLHWGGRGGSSVIMFPEVKAALAYAPNKFYRGRGTYDARGTPLREAAIECLKAL